jgi:NitT/TauT family transport system substrate-binding protein
VRRRILATVALAGIAIAVAVSSATAGPRAANLTTIKLGVYPSADYAPLFVGLKRGIFKKHGLDVKITYIYTGSGLMAAATSGQLDVVTNSVTAGINAIIQGLPLKMLTATDVTPVKGNTEVLVKSDSPIKSFKDLAGKTVATVNLQGLFQLGVNYAMEKAGADPSSLKAVAMAPTDEPNALQAGRLDAIVLQDPFLAQAKAQGGFRSLGNPFAAVPYKVPAGAFYASNSEIQSKPGFLRSFVTAFKEAVAVSVKNPALTRRIIPKYTGIKPEIAKAITPPDFTTALPPGSLGGMLRAMKKWGWINQVPGYDQLVWSGK